MISRKKAKQLANTWLHSQDQGFPTGSLAFNRKTLENRDLLFDVMYYDLQLARLIVERQTGNITVTKFRNREIAKAHVLANYNG